MRTLVFLTLTLLAGACGMEPSTPEEPSTGLVLLEEAKADGLEKLRVRAAGMTVWAEPTLITDLDGFVLSARSSYDIAAVTAQVGGESLEAQRVSSRKLEVRLTAQGLVALLEEQPLLVAVTTTSGKVRTVLFTARATFGPSSGSSKIYPWKSLDPVVVGGETMFRGRLTTRGEFVEVYGSNDDDSEPVMRQEDATHWIADFPAYALPWAAHPTEDAVNFTATDADGERVRRAVSIVIEVTGIGITSEDPAEVWPAQGCEAPVQRCVEDLGPDADLEACGSVAEVRPCLADVPVDLTPQLHKKFADGLRAALIDYYSRHEAAVLAAGGNPRTAALASVDTAKMTEVTDPDEDPSGRDLDAFRVFTHPDVVYPGSDIVWFGVFDRRDDSLVEVFDFN